MNEIGRFKGEFEFLSNFFIHPVTHGGLTYPHSEAAFQAQKTLDEDRREPFTNPKLKPWRSKKMGRALPLRPGWEAMKLNVMVEVLRSKFSGELAVKLLATGNALLTEGNYWHDNVWGVCRCARCPGAGENLLGRALTLVRYKLTQRDATK